MLPVFSPGNWSIWVDLAIWGDQIPGLPSDHNEKVLCNLAIPAAQVRQFHPFSDDSPHLLCIALVVCPIAKPDYSNWSIMQWRFSRIASPKAFVTDIFHNSLDFLISPNSSLISLLVLSKFTNLHCKQYNLVRFWLQNQLIQSGLRCLQFSFLWLPNWFLRTNFDQYPLLLSLSDVCRCLMFALEPIQNGSFEMNFGSFLCERTLAFGRSHPKFEL